jgi:Hemerythrin HHE cation binding domain
MTKLPAALAPLAENRQQLSATLDLLDRTSELVIRADLASELVGISARYEDVKARVVYPALRSNGANSNEIDRAEENQRSVRDALSDIRRRTRHVKPDYVHADDPEGFEEALSGLVEAIRIHTEHEDNVLFPRLADLDAQTSDELLVNVEYAVTHASTHPNPPHSRIGRAIIAAGEKLEHDVKDESTPQHPGVDKLSDELAIRKTVEG